MRNRNLTPTVIDRSKTPVVSELISSPRLDRLRALFAHLDEIAAAPPEAFTDADLDPVCDEISAISDDIIAAPSPGLVGLAEHGKRGSHERAQEAAHEDDDARGTRLLSGNCALG